MTDIIVAIDTAGRSMFADLGLPDSWLYDFADATAGVMSAVTAYISGPNGQTMRIRHECGACSLYGPYSVAIRRDGAPDVDIKGDTMQALAAAVGGAL